MLKGFKRIFAPAYLNGKVATKVTVTPNVQTFENVNLFYNGFGYVKGVPSLWDTDQVYNTLRADQPTDASTNNPSGGYDNTFRYFISSIKLKTEYRNATTAPLDLAIYDIVARKDQSQVTTGVSPFFQYNPSIGSPTTTWANGLTEEAIPFPGVGTSLMGADQPGAKPFLSEKFCHFYRVAKVNHMTLGPGESHIHWVSIRPGRLFNRTYTRLLGAMAGHTYFQMCIIRGGVAHKQLDATKVSYSEAALDIITEYSYKANMFSKNRTTAARFEEPIDPAGFWEQVNEDVAAIQNVAP
jgi:hypothetical protein